MVNDQLSELVDVSYYFIQLPESPSTLMLMEAGFKIQLKDNYENCAGIQFGSLTKVFFLTLRALSGM